MTPTQHAAAPCCAPSLAAAPNPRRGHNAFGALQQTKARKGSPEMLRASGQAIRVNVNPSPVDVTAGRDRHASLTRREHAPDCSSRRQLAGLRQPPASMWRRGTFRCFGGGSVARKRRETSVPKARKRGAPFRRICGRLGARPVGCWLKSGTPGHLPSSDSRLPPWPGWRRGVPGLWPPFRQGAPSSIARGMNDVARA